jgi:uncharacterized membrane protein YbhN (UPF0104 family)
VGILPVLADFSQVWSAIRSLGWGEVVVLFAFAGWNLLTYQFVTMAALPGLSLGRAFMVGQISTAVSNTVPAGSAVGIGITYAMFSSYGYSAVEIGLAAALSGIWNLFAKLGLPIVAFAIVAFRGDPNPALLSTAVVGLGVLLAAVAAMVLFARSEALAHRLGGWLGTAATSLARPLRRGPFDDWPERFVRFRTRTEGLLAQRWHWLTATSLLSHLSLFALLLVSLRLLGVPAEDVTTPEALAAFALVRLVTALPITPGGVGVVELGMSAALVVAGGAEAPVVAAVLVYRTLTYALQIPVGLVCWIIWRAQSARSTVP